MNGGSKARKKRRRDLERWHRRIDQRFASVDLAKGNSYSAAVFGQSLLNAVIPIVEFEAIKKSAALFAVSTANMVRAMTCSLAVPAILLFPERLPEGSAPFVQEMRSDPGNPVPRLIYADWLEERGHIAWASLLRGTDYQYADFEQLFTNH